MTLQTAGDIPIQVTSENSSSERRITPSWTVAQLKVKLEPVTGIPPSSQKLSLRNGTNESRPIETADEEGTQLVAFPLAPYAEIYVADLRPISARPNFTDASQVPKYELPPAEYEQKTDSVLAWKKTNKLGRFDPSASSAAAAADEARIAVHAAEVQNRGVAVGKRCRVGGEDEKRGTVMYVGEVEEIPHGKGVWVGVRLDEPVGKNDGSIGGRRYWKQEVEGSFGVFVRPERVEIGEWPALNDLEDMEEI